MPYKDAASRKAYRKRYYAKDRAGAADAVRQWRKANPEERNRQQRDNYKKNSEKHRAYQKAWRQDNPDKVLEYRERRKPKMKEYARAYQENNRDRLKEKARRYYLEKGREARRGSPEKYRKSARDYYQRHKDKILAKVRTKFRGSKYGISDAECRHLDAEQNGRCAICRREPIGGKKSAARLNVDHDHENGMARGLLCHICNLALGGFGDDLGRLGSAMDYLRLWKHRHRESSEKSAAK